MILVGIDDTDVLDSPGTNQLARAMARAVEHEWRTVRIVRHQLFYDPRVPYTSKNGSASIAFEPRGAASPVSLIDTCRRVMRDWFIDGSDPGLCVADDVGDQVVAFGRQCQTDLARQADARKLAESAGIHLEGLGGTNDGVIGALAAVGLAKTGNDGRIVQIGEWPDDLSGLQSLDTVQGRSVIVRHVETTDRIDNGMIDVGKRLRPNLRDNRCVLFVRPSAGAHNRYEAVRQP